jgi:hypothetical protein
MVYGVGLTDIESTRNGKLTKEYKLWINMLGRCYSEKELLKRPSYRDCKVSENFLILSNFKDWCSKQVGFTSKDAKGKSFQLDKDLLLKGSKIYSEYTCCFVPNEINGFLTKANTIRGKYLIGVSWCKKRSRFVSMIKIDGKNVNLGGFDSEWEAFLAYKKTKEFRAKELAERWKGQIDDRVYGKLINYKVLLTD